MPSNGLEHCSSLRVGIAGAGLMGRLLAWQLHQLGHQVTLFDQAAAHEEASAAFVAAGMLAPYAELESADASIYKLGMRSLELWPQLVQGLEAEALLQTQGSLIVAHAQDKPYLQRFCQQLAHHQIPHSHAQTLNKSQLNEQNTGLGEIFGEAVYLPQEAWVNSRELMHVLAQRLHAGGVKWQHQCPVTAVNAGHIQLSTGQFACDWAIDCRGLGAQTQLPELRGVRGEVIEVYAPEVNIQQMVRLMHPHYRLYLVPRPKHHYVLGATQLETNDASPISVRSALELLSALYSLHPGFAEARIVRTASGCRPALPDNGPKLIKQPGLLRINGLFRHGFLLAPAMAEQAIHYLTDNLAKAAIHS